MRRGEPAAAVAFAILFFDVYDLISRVCVCMCHTANKRVRKKNSNPLPTNQILNIAIEKNNKDTE